MNCKARGLISVVLWVLAACSYLIYEGVGLIIAMVLGLVSGVILYGCDDPVGE